MGFDYEELLKPIFNRVRDHLEAMEVKHGAGITLKDDDLEAAIGHIVSHMRGKPNDDGETHLIAAIIRIIKQEL